MFDVVSAELKYFLFGIGKHKYSTFGLSVKKDIVYIKMLTIFAVEKQLTLMSTELVAEGKCMGSGFRGLEAELKCPLSDSSKFSGISIRTTLFHRFCVTQ